MYFGDPAENRYELGLSPTLVTFARKFGSIQLRHSVRFDVHQMYPSTDQSQVFTTSLAHHLKPDEIKSTLSTHAQLHQQHATIGECNRELIRTASLSVASFKSVAYVLMRGGIGTRKRLPVAIV